MIMYPSGIMGRVEDLTYNLRLMAPELKIENEDRKQVVVNNKTTAACKTSGQLPCARMQLEVEGQC